MSRWHGWVVAAASVLAVAGCDGEENVRWSRPEGTNLAGMREVRLSQTPAPAVQAQGSGMSPGAPAGGAMGIPAPPSVKVEITSTSLSVGSVAFAIPDGWKSVPPRSRMRVAQFELPGEAGPAEMVIFYFGPGQGGSAEANVKRWVGMFSRDDGTTGPVETEAAQFEQDGLRVALVKARGTYTPANMGPMMVDAPEPRPNHALYGAVIEGSPQGSLFVRTTGPIATMEAQESALQFFVRSVRQLK